MSAPSQFAAAIAAAEGFNTPGSIPATHNNPGDLVNWPGVPADANGYSIFATAADGWNALQEQLDLILNGGSAYYNPEMSIAQMGSIWSGGDPNWALNVAAYLGTTTNVMIGGLLAAPSGATSTFT